MNLEHLKKVYADNGCTKIFVKILAQNDLSKSQVYFGGNFDVLNIFPISDVTADSSGNWESERFKATMNFSWIDNEGSLHSAPHSKLILYPAYPEVRFSGFLLGCKNGPSELMNQKIPGRLLFLGVSRGGKVLGYVVGPDSEISIQFSQERTLAEGIFNVIELPILENSRQKLLRELSRIYELGWIKSKKLTTKGDIVDCIYANCGGYTLEAEFGITPNGFAAPDFLGWELKQFGVNNLDKITSQIITLMTPEPTDGFYRTSGAEAFVRRYGYNDISGKPDRMNFGGIYRKGNTHARTGLRLELIGYDDEEKKIRNSDGRIALIDPHENEAASWSFTSMLKHWNQKHNQACYVPSLMRSVDGQSYRYGNNVLLGTGTDFQFFLKEMSLGNIYYDPGIKVENISVKPKLKKRSQFRIKSLHLPNLYKHSEIVDVTKNVP